MSTLPLPRSLPGLTLAGFLLVDLPVLAAIGVVGWFYGYAHTYEAVMGWRMAHPWSLLPSAAAAFLIVRRIWRRSRCDTC